MSAARALLAQRRAKREEMLAALLPQQRAAIEDPARLKAFFCPRRSGKSWAVGASLLLAALAQPGCSCLYLGLTRGSAHGIMLKDILLPLVKRHALDAVWVESKNRLELPNGSVIYMRGADANAYEIEKFVGQKYHYAVLDEASKFRQDLDRMVYGSLLPAMGDSLGTIALAGTPSNLTGTLFHRVTTGEEPGWHTHHWTWRDNIDRLPNVAAAHAEYVAAKPHVVGTPLYRQEWLGEWVVDTNALVYVAREDRNTIEALPPGKYTYVLGIDTGYKDPTAFVVVAWSDYDRVLYVVEARKQSGLTFSEATSIVKENLVPRYDFAKMVVDAALQGAEEMRRHGDLPLHAAEKGGKHEAITLFNDQLNAGNIKVLPAAMACFEEWAALVWDERRRRDVPPHYVEDGKCENHLADACLYAWRASHAYAPGVAPKVPELRSEDWVLSQLVREAEAKRDHAAAPFGFRAAGDPLASSRPRFRSRG